MCPCRNTKTVKVKISASLSYTGKERWKMAKIDQCIAPLVKALQGKEVSRMRNDTLKALRPMDDCGMGMEAKQESITESLNRRKGSLEAQLAEVNAAIEALRENPAVEMCLTLVGRALHY
jgi:hypothetical protein